MYLRTDHVETNVPTLRQFIHDNPLGIITTAIPSKTHPFIQSSHVPWILDVDDKSSETELGMLRGHMARANPQSKAIVDILSKDKVENGVEANDEGHFLEDEVLIMFDGPAHSYVTPKFYLETKPANGKVVPTWNYSAVQVYGRAKIYYDSKSATTTSYLQKQITDLTVLSEGQLMPSEKPWTLDEAPRSYVDLLRKAIIGVEIEITRLEGKFKMSQERPLGDRNGVIDGFTKLETDVGKAMAGAVKERGDMRDAEKMSVR